MSTRPHVGQMNSALKTSPFDLGNHIKFDSREDVTPFLCVYQRFLLFVEASQYNFTYFPTIIVVLQHKSLYVLSLFVSLIPRMLEKCVFRVFIYSDVVVKVVIY